MISTTPRKAKGTNGLRGGRSERRPKMIGREPCEQVNRASPGPSLRFGPTGDRLAVAAIWPSSAQCRELRTDRGATIATGSPQRFRCSIDGPEDQPRKEPAMIGYREHMTRMAARVRRRREGCSCLYCSGALYEALADPVWTIRDAVRHDRRPVPPVAFGARHRSHDGDGRRRQTANRRAARHP